MLTRLQWQRIREDLARHLGSALSLEQIRQILDDAERDVARLGQPSDFWQGVELEYEKVTSRLDRSRDDVARELVDSVRALIAIRRGP